MSPTGILTNPEKPPPSEQPGEQVSVRLDELLVGRPLIAPLYDEKGVLLLAAGKEVTSDFKRLLKQRGDGTVRMTEADARRLRLCIQVEETPFKFALDGETSSKLDKMIESGLLNVKNTGPAAKERIVYHGRKAFNLERHANLQDQRQSASESVGAMIQASLSGKTIQSSSITQSAAQFFGDLADDSDHLLSVVLEASRDESLSDHCLKMATLGMALGVEMGLDADNCRRICVAGMVHDWGMAAIDLSLRNSSSILTEHEMFQIRKHPIITAELLERMPGIPSQVPVVAYQVHEKVNGRGYPRGCVKDRIHLFARILAVADTYSALTSPRPHRAAMMPYAAMECVVKLAHRKELDADVVRALLNVLTLFPIGSFVSLNDFRLARVIRRHEKDYSRPFVQIVQDADGNPVDPTRDDSVIDLTTSGLKITQALPTPGKEELELSNNILIVPRKFS